MQIIDIEQGTPEWHEVRRCKISGTKLDAVMGSALDRTNLIAELIAEEATEQSKIMKATAEMERGTAEEEFAVKKFEERTGKKVDRIGVCLSEDNDWICLSPDGLIKDEKGNYTEALEVKCPDSKTAIFNRIANMIPVDETGLTKSKHPFLGIPAQYKWQCVHYFLVNRDLQKLNFAIYDARFINDDEKLYVVTIDRENPELQQAVKQAKEALIEFYAEWMRWKEIVLPTNF